MFKKIFNFLLLLNSATAYCQTQFEPQIAILAPGKITYDKAFVKDVLRENAKIKEGLKKNSPKEVLNSQEFRDQPDNFKKITKNDIFFLSDRIDFFKGTSMNIERYLQYRFYEHFPNLLITVIDRKSIGTKSVLRRESERDSLQYVLNIPDISLYKKEGKSYANLRLQLYDHSNDSIVLDKVYTGDWVNPGFEFSCKDSSISCCISNALSFAMPDVISIVASNSPTLKRERRLKYERDSALINHYYPQSYDKSFIIPIIKDSNVDITSQYYCLIDKSKSKFVSFFLQPVPKQGFKDLTTTGDKNIKVITDKDIKDSGFLDEMPQVYAYVVKGVKYNGQWYYEKSEATYFDAGSLEDARKQYFKNLESWNFFKENSIDTSNNFWETSLFDKVKDLTKDPNWEKYKDMWQREEEENRPFVGMYTIVANKLKPQGPESDMKHYSIDTK